MKIYTKTGDAGLTSLWGGGQVKKSDLRVMAYGTLDEANSAIGVALSFFPTLPNPSLNKILNETLNKTLNETKEQLVLIQNQLFQVGAELATKEGAKNSCPEVRDADIEKLEREIDAMEIHLEPLQNFILPSGSSPGSFLHLARTIIRRAERECVALGIQVPLRPEVLKYVNRLSDYLFVCARFVNHELKSPETKWAPRNQAAPMPSSSRD